MLKILCLGTALFCYNVPKVRTLTAMKLLGRNRLRDLYGSNEQVQAWVRGWVSELSYANWKGAQDVLHQFPRAQCLANNIFSFPVDQQPQVIEVAIVFAQAVVLVTDLKSTS